MSVKWPVVFKAARYRILPLPVTETRLPIRTIYLIFLQISKIIETKMCESIYFLLLLTMVTIYERNKFFMKNFTEFFKNATLSNNFLYFKSIILNCFIFGAIFIATSISVSTAGQPGDGWHRFPGWARDIAVGFPSSPYVIGTDPAPGGYGIYTCNGYWHKIDGGGVQISVDDYGFPWIVDSSGAIFRRSFVTV